MHNVWQKQSVVITGGTGFIGTHLTRRLVELGANVRIITRDPAAPSLRNISDKLNITVADLTKPQDDNSLMFSPDAIVFHLASRVAGIQYNNRHPMEMFETNSRITTAVLQAIAKTRVKKFIAVSSACVYPRFAPIPIHESSGFTDEPEPTNSGYGWAKRMLEVGTTLLYREYTIPSVIVRPFNAYGPGQTTDPVISHVIPSLITRILDGENPLTVWGTGRQIRSFLYVADLVEGLLLAAEKMTTPEPVNLSTDEQTTIQDLAHCIAQETGKSVTLKFDTTRPDGQPKRIADTTKAASLLGFRAKTSLREGIKQTILWHQKQRS